MFVNQKYSRTIITQTWNQRKYMQEKETKIFWMIKFIPTNSILVYI